MTLAAVEHTSVACAFCGTDVAEVDGFVSLPRATICYRCVGVVAELARIGRENRTAEVRSISQAWKPGPFVATDNPIYSAQGGISFYCRRPMHLDSKHNGPTRDHFIPKSKRKVQHQTCNTVYAHKGCNSRKGSRMPTPEEARRFLALMEALGMPPHPKAIEIAGKA